MFYQSFCINFLGTAKIKLAMKYFSSMNLRNNNIVKVNFKGGIITPTELYNILIAVSKFNILYVRFGLRQQLLFDVAIEELMDLTAELEMLGIVYEINNDEYPNIISSYPAEEVFIIDTWLKEEVYKKLLESIDYSPRLKINISDTNQSFTPLLTGNINWVASPAAIDYWHLFIRFPKTNVVYEWKDVISTEDISGLSKHIEELIFQNRDKFFDNENASGDDLYTLVNKKSFNKKQADSPLELPAFSIPYYEGINRYNDKYWLGIYRRDELFRVKFLKEVCLLCMETKTKQLCSTPWKTIIIKGIEEKNRKEWIGLLDKYQVNVRHAANELNFQVEDNNLEALKLKEHLVKYLNEDDTRTFGVCIGIKMRRKSEVFCSILVRQRALIKIGRLGLFKVYDILCAKNFNPNERTAFAYSTGNPKFLLAEQLRRAILTFYDYKNSVETILTVKNMTEDTGQQ